MKKYLISIIIIMFCLANNLLRSQDVTLRGWLLKYDVISLLGDQVSSSMGVRLGVEFMTGRDQSLSADIMYIFPCTSCGEAYTRIETEKTVGFLISADYSFYLITGKQAFSGFHLGPRLAYQFTQADMYETYQNGIPNTYQVYRNMIAAHAMAGYQIRIAGPLYFDPALGFGFRFISSRNENKMGDDPGQHEFIYNKDYESGAQFFPSFDISIKIGLKL